MIEPVIELAFQTYNLYVIELAFQTYKQAAQSRKRHLGLSVVLDFRWLGGAGQREIKTTSPIWRGNVSLSCIKTTWTNSIELNFGTRMS
jgi:hypothetical protein